MERKCDDCYCLPCACSGQSEWKVLNGKRWAAKQQLEEETEQIGDAAEQPDVPEKRPEDMSREEICQKFCVGPWKAFGCSVCKPGLRLFGPLSKPQGSEDEDIDGENDVDMKELLQHVVPLVAASMRSRAQSST